MDRKNVLYPAFGNTRSIGILDSPDTRNTRVGSGETTNPARTGPGLILALNPGRSEAGNRKCDREGIRTRESTMSHEKILLNLDDFIRKGS